MIGSFFDGLITVICLPLAFAALAAGNLDMTALALLALAVSLWRRRSYASVTTTIERFRHSADYGQPSPHERARREEWEVE